MSFPVTVGLKYGEEKLTYTSNQNGRELGTVAVLPDGRKFRWTLNGGTALEAGKLVQSAVQVGASVHTGALDVTSAATTGVTSLSVVFATTPTTKDLYKDGYVNVDTSPGQGLYKVNANAAATSGVAGVVTLEEDDKLRAALTSGTSKVGLFRNPYTSVVVAPASATGAVVGATPVAVAANSYFWAQTWGPASVNSDAALAPNKSVILGATDGNLNVATSALNDVAAPRLGHALTATAAGADKYTFVFLTLP